MAEEVELTFRIISPDPEGVFRDISSRSSMGAFRLVSRGSFAMRDTYLDTPGFGLGRKGYALRLRERNGAVMLALKGREEERPGGGVSRLEIEGPCSVEILEEVAREIGPGLVKENAFDRDEPLRSLEAMGFVVIQDRETTRTRIDAFSGDEQTPFAEIALDRVRYHAEGKGYLHWEIEIEALGNVCQDLLSAYAGCLQEAFPGKLESWEHNKLITGMALGRLLQRSELPRAGDDDAPVPLSWYDAMEAWIKRMKP
jgi:inorganic triphosphatase YgiF